MSWDSSIKPFCDSCPDVASIWVGTKDGAKWCEVGTASGITAGEISEYSKGGKKFGGTSFIKLRNVEGFDVFKKSEKSLAAFKGSKMVIVAFTTGPKPEACLKTMQGVIDYLRTSKIEV